MSGVDPADARAEKAAYRAFVRANHPDVGGDPAAFAAGIERFRSAARDTTTGKPEPDRYDGPVVFVNDGRGIGRAFVAIRKRLVKRNNRPRVR
jgi:hypothetical protein